MRTSEISIIYRVIIHERVGYIKNLNIRDGTSDRVFFTYNIIDFPSIIYMPSF
jgi:hypothetical protein